jgi:hypothetical protein
MFSSKGLSAEPSGIGIARIVHGKRDLAQVEIPAE